VTRLFLLTKANRAHRRDYSKKYNPEKPDMLQRVFLLVLSYFSHVHIYLFRNYVHPWW